MKSLLKRIPLFRQIAFHLSFLAFASTFQGKAQSLNEVRILETDLIASKGNPTDPARVTLVRTGSTASSLAVNLLIGGTATPDLDYLRIPSPVTIPAGLSRHEIAIFPYAGEPGRGSETIQVTVEDGAGYTAASPATATATVFDTQFEAWQPNHFNAAQLANLQISGLAADPDNDSTSNLGEFFAGSDPMTFDSGPVANLTKSNGLLLMSIRRNPSASALVVRIEESGTLSGWKSMDPQPAMHVETNNGWELLSFQIPQPAPGIDGFLRASISHSPAEAFDFYVDSVSGNDLNVGSSPATAFATITKALNATSANRSASIGLARGQRHVPTTTATFGVTGHWGAYGNGHMPFVDCSLPVPPAITPHEQYTNVYVVEITHAVAPDFNDPAREAWGPHFGLWWESTGAGIQGEYLQPVFNATNIAAAELYVKNNPGKMFVQKVGGTQMDARREARGSQTFRYVFQLANSSDPRQGGHLRYACYTAVGIIFRNGATISDIAFGRCSGKDLTSTPAYPDDVAPIPSFSRCLWLDSGCHGNVGPSNWKGCVALTRTLARNNGSGGWHNFTGAFHSAVPVCEESFIGGYFQAIYSHGAGQSPVQKSMIARRVIIDDCQTAFSIPPTTDLAIFEDARITNCDSLLNGNALLRRFTAQIRDIAFGERRELFNSFNKACGTLEDGIIKFPQTNECFVTPFAPTQAHAEALGTPTLRRITITPPNMRGGTTESTQRYIKYVFENTVGVRTAYTDDINSSILLANASMSNSYIGPVNSRGNQLFSTLADYQARVPGAANSTVMFNQNEPATFAEDPLVDPTLTGPASIVGKGMGVNPQIIRDLPAKLHVVPTLQSMGFKP